MKALYPASNILENLDHTKRALKIARHSPCSLCNNSCLGLQPPLGIKAVPDESASPFQGLFDYGSDDDDEPKDSLSYLEFCQCGHDVKYHGANEAEIGSEEFTRRARVAIRLDELIQVCTPGLSHLSG
jgi:histone acetyltransferase